MQSGYGGGGGGGGGVSDLQQFLVPDGSAVFSLSTNPTPPSSAAAAAVPLSSHPFINYHHHHNPLLHLHHQPPQPPLLTPFGMPFLPIPVPPPPPPAAATQQLFYQEHDFRLFHTHSPSPPPPPPLPQENHSGGSDDTGPSLLSAAAVNFKLAVDSGGGGPEEESAIKELSWRPLDIDFLHNSGSSNNKRHKSGGSCDRHDEPEPEPSSKYGEKRSGNGNADNYKLFCELEAIYKPGTSSAATTPTAATAVNQTGSGSALTGDDYPIIAAAAVNEAPDDVGGTSETSAGEEAAAARNCQKAARNKERRRQRRQRRKQQQLQAMVGFMEATVKRLMDHQESLHRSFLEAAERRDRERTRSDESWREQAAARSSQEAAARARDRALADARDAALISFLESVSGDRIHLSEESESCYNRIAATSTEEEYSTSRWPRGEVEALIAVRSGLEARFQEPGLKGPLWEEASARMAGLGFRRSAKRCKEKWENINKYFRKAKESGRARPQHAKTCPYFHHLDVLYSSRSANSDALEPLPLPPAPPPPPTDANSELLDAVVVSKDHVGFKFGGGGDRNQEGKDNDDEEDDDQNQEVGGEQDPTNCNKKL